MSGEWPVYRAGRQLGIHMLGLRPGDRVLDVGCGTGLNFSLLEEAVGRPGVVAGVDSSAVMLARARARVGRHGWANVRLVQADAGRPGATPFVAEWFDAVLFTFSLSVIADPGAAWRAALGAVRPSARVGVVDLAMPSGVPAVFAPLAMLACAAGGAKWRRVWEWVARDCTDVAHRALRGGTSRSRWEPARRVPCPHRTWDERAGDPADPPAAQQREGRGRLAGFPIRERHGVAAGRMPPT